MKIKVFRVMLFFFRINDLSRIILLGVILALIRMPFWIKGIPVIENVFQFQLLAEGLAEDRLVYRDIWHYVSPLSALFFQLIGELFGRGAVFFQILGYALLLAQAIYFNSILNKLEATREKTLIPALFYIFFGSIFIEQFAVSQELLAMFPLLMTFSLVMEQIRYGADTERFYKIGFVFSVAVLFYGSLFWILPFLLFYFPFVFVMYGRRFTLFLTGFLFPFIGLGLYFFLKGELSALLYQYIYQIIIPYYKNYFTIVQYVLIFAVPVILFLLGLFQSLFRSRSLNFQSSYNYFYIVMGFSALPVFYFSKELSVKSFTLLIPVWTFFSAQLYLLIRRRSINELIISSLLILMVFINFGFTYKAFFNPNVINIDKIEVVVSSEMTSKRVSVLSDNLGYWYDNQYSGPFLFYPFTEAYFTEGLNVDKINRLHDLYIKEAPDLVIDEMHFFETLRKSDAILEKDYNDLRNGRFIRQN